MVNGVSEFLKTTGHQRSQYRHLFVTGKIILITKLLINFH